MQKVILTAAVLAVFSASLPPARAQEDGGGIALDDMNGNPFMEEVVTGKPKPKPKPVPIDLSRVGVSVDPHGNIVPLKDSANDPWAASGVKPFYNHIETSTTMPYVYGLPGYGLPGYGAPGYGLPGYGVPGYGVPGYGLPGYGLQGYGYGYGRPFGYPGYGGPFGSPFYGYAPGNRMQGLLGAALAGAGAGLYAASTGYNPYAGAGLSGYGLPFNSPFNAYGSPYSPYGGMPLGVGYTTTGNSATFISNDPTTGAPIAPGPGGNSQTNFGSASGTFATGPWLSPTTSFQQNSMWKAFNLAF
jgi:hypothetical protein